MIAAVCVYNTYTLKRNIDAIIMFNNIILWTWRAIKRFPVRPTAVRYYYCRGLHLAGPHRLIATPSRHSVYDPTRVYDNPARYLPKQNICFLLLLLLLSSSSSSSSEDGCYYYFFSPKQTSITTPWPTWIRQVRRDSTIRKKWYCYLIIKERYCYHYELLMNYLYVLHTA